MQYNFFIELCEGNSPSGVICGPRVHVAATGCVPRHAWPEGLRLSAAPRLRGPRGLPQCASCPHRAAWVSLHLLRACLPFCDAPTFTMASASHPTVIVGVTLASSDMTRALSRSFRVRGTVTGIGACWSLASVPRSMHSINCSSALPSSPLTGLWPGPSSNTLTCTT